MKNFYLLALLAVLQIYFVTAQNTNLVAGNGRMQVPLQISGTVVDDKDEPVAGASVVVKGTTTGVSTGINGNYDIQAAADAVLVFSFIGLGSREEQVDGRSRIDVKMSGDALQIEDIVVIGYGAVRKRDLTGAVSSVNEKMLKNVPAVSASEALTGRLAGVNVTTTEGSPDAEIKIRVRGGGSISQDNSPLFIVDGFPVNSISDIPAGDIQSMDVLKDASSTAIYGARGANGVIIVTTKRGTEGKVSVNFNTYLGVKKNVKEYKVLSPYEYVMYQYEIDNTSAFQNNYGAFEDLELYKNIKGRNFQDEVFGRTAMSQYYNLSVNGGSKMAKYNISLTRTAEEAIMIGSGFERNNINISTNSEVSKWVSIDFNSRLAYTLIDGAGVNTGSGATSRLRNSVKYAPTKGLREFSGDDAIDDPNSPEASSLLNDPVASTNDEYKNQRRFSNDYTMAINWKPVKFLTYRSEAGYGFGYNRTDQVWGKATGDAKQNGGMPLARITDSERQQWRIANTLTFDKQNILQGHNLTAMIGQELNSTIGKSIESNSRFFPQRMTAEDILAMMNLGEASPTITKINQPNNLASFFGRINYSGLDKYIASFTLRADGSSKFAAGNQWGLFPSGAVAWRISSEPFMKPAEKYLSDLKLRFSSGLAGNNRISDGLWKATFATSTTKPYFENNTMQTQLVPGSTLSNPDLRWETTWTNNFGVDASLFNSRLTVTLELYKNTTTDLLVESPIPTSTGYAQQMRNIGQTSNQGVEMTIEGVAINKEDMFFSVSFNVGFNKNKVDKFVNGENNYKAYSSGWNGSATPTEDYLIREGEPIGQMYGYVTDGYYTFEDFTFDYAAKKWILNADVPDNSTLLSYGDKFGPGALKFKDINNDGKIDANDKKVIGNALPLFSGGINLSFRYKGFDASAFFNFSVGNDVYNANKLDYSAYLLSRKYQNIIDDMSLANRFTTIDPITGRNVFNGTYADPVRLQEINTDATMWMPLHTQTQLHSWAIEDASFIRLNTATIGYTLPAALTKKFFIQQLRLYVTGYNLFCLTRYSGFDPEVDTRGVMTPGVDYSAYPKSRSFTAGLNITF